MKDEITTAHRRALASMLVRYSPSAVAKAMALAAGECADSSARFAEATGVEEAAYEPVMRDFSRRLQQVAEEVEDSLGMMSAVSPVRARDPRSVRTDKRDRRPLADD